jgi:hypothetical protein
MLEPASIEHAAYNTRAANNRRRPHPTAPPSLADGSPNPNPNPNPPSPWQTEAVEPPSPAPKPVPPPPPTRKQVSRVRVRVRVRVSVSRCDAAPPTLAARNTSRMQHQPHATPTARKGGFALQRTAASRPPAPPLPPPSRPFPRPVRERTPGEGSNCTVTHANYTVTHARSSRPRLHF